MKISRRSQGLNATSTRILSCWIALVLILALPSTCAFAQSTNGILLTTFIKPIPDVDDNFGNAVAAVGNDRVIIGAPEDDTGAAFAGAAYLFSTSGTLLTAFTNPTPAVSDRFGFAVASVGNDQVIIGAPYDDTGAKDTGAVYLFTTNGTLLTTFTNPTPSGLFFSSSEKFGYAVAAVGSDRVLIGAPEDDAGATDAGAAYLFSTNGTLLTTFTNPIPASGDYFGTAVAAVGGDRVLIGAPYDVGGAGAAYLFSTNGTLLTTFTKPAPVASDIFGFSVAAVGTDRILIGALFDDTGGTDAGAAYLFSTNGTLLTTFTNPTPTAFDSFGYAVAAVGRDRVLISARADDINATDNGVAYLFSTNGTLLTTFTNPTPAAYDNFGVAVAAMGSDQVLIGANMDGTGASHAGAAYLFEIPYPPLSIARSDSTILLGWVSPETGLVLQQADALTSITPWSNTKESVAITGLTNSVQQTLSGEITNRFFRLRRP